MANLKTRTKGRKDKESEQYLPDPESEDGTMAPERNKELDDVIERYLDAKETIAECRETMKDALEEMLQLANSNAVMFYRYTRGQTVFSMEITSQQKVRLKRVNTE